MKPMMRPAKKPRVNHIDSTFKNSLKITAHNPNEIQSFSI